MSLLNYTQLAYGLRDRHNQSRVGTPKPSVEVEGRGKMRTGVLGASGGVFEAPGAYDSWLRAWTGALSARGDGGVGGGVLA